MSPLKPSIFGKGIIFLFLALFAGLATAEDLFSENPEIGTELNALFITKQHPWLRNGNFIHRSEDMAELYKRANNQLLWLGNDKSAKNTADALDLLASAANHGLIKENYDVDTLRSKYNQALSLDSDSYKDLVLYDTAVSIALLRFLHDLHYGRVNPEGINFKLQPREKKDIDLSAIIFDSLNLNTIAQLPLLVEPKLQQYQKLKAALMAYRSSAEKASRLQLAFTGTLKPGGKHPQLVELSRYLASVGDLPTTAVLDPSEKSPAYNKELVEAVKKFQLRHGIGADGTIGPSTVAALNEPLSDKVKQIELAMERLRWLPEMSKGRAIIVNIPSYQLWAIDDLSNPWPNIVTMRVVVGKALKNQTPVLMAPMSLIEFAPYWNVPKKIFDDEILPKLSKNPGVLASQNMEIVANFGDEAKPIPLSEDALQKLKKGTLRVRQRPGKRNSLGKVKFIFPNKDDVYLHDTPAGALFRRSRRDFSHGCVRVEKPAVLAQFALKNEAKWDAAAVKKAMARDTVLRVRLHQPIPVLFFYTTAFVDQNNNLVFYPDIYSNNKVLEEALKRPDDLPDPSIFVSSHVKTPLSPPQPTQRNEQP